MNISDEGYTFRGLGVSAWEYGFLEIFFVVIDSFYFPPPCRIRCSFSRLLSLIPLILMPGCCAPFGVRHTLFTFSTVMIRSGSTSPAANFEQGSCIVFFTLLLGFSMASLLVQSVWHIPHLRGDMLL